MSPEGYNKDFIWWKHGVLYQIYPRSFADSDGDGIGDLKGLTKRLDYLADLGIDGIWLSPIFPSPMKDFGYDISDYRDIDSIFGSLEIFNTLITEAHGRGIRVILDMVFNHSSDLHPWFIESRESRNNSKRDWYIWHPGKKGRPPNNWRSAFGGSAWTLDEKSGEYFLHSFLKQQPDLNWRNLEVREALYSILRFWMDAGVDGFRFDVINYIVKDEAFRSNPYRFHWTLPRRHEQQDHIFDRGRPESHKYLKELRTVLDEYPDRMSVGEIFPNEGIIDQKASASYLGRGEDELHLAFDFSPNYVSFKAEAFARILSGQYNAVPDTGWPVHVLSNHDQSRAMTRLAGGSIDKMKLLLAMLLTQRGTPFLYYGDEIGMEDGRIPRNQIQDPVGIKYWPLHPGRDPARTPMLWDNTEAAGFTTGIPWLPVSSRNPEDNVADQWPKPSSLLRHTRRLIKLRSERPSLSHGSWELMESPRGVLSYRRIFENEVTLVLLNFTPRTVKVPLPAQTSGKQKIQIIYGFAPDNVSAAGSLGRYNWVILGN